VIDAPAAAPAERILRISKTIAAASALAGKPADRATGAASPENAPNPIDVWNNEGGA
jgi:hypothetical protein